MVLSNNVLTAETLYSGEITNDFYFGEPLDSVRIEPTTMTNIDPFTWKTGTGIVSIEEGYLNLREEPTTDSKIIATIGRGSSVTIYGFNSTWYCISITDDETGITYSGYVYQEFVNAKF